MNRGRLITRGSAFFRSPLLASSMTLPLLEASKAGGNLASSSIRHPMRCHRKRWVFARLTALCCMARWTLPSQNDPSTCAMRSPAKWKRIDPV